MTYDTKLTGRQETCHFDSNAREQSKNRGRDEGIKVVEDLDASKPRQTRTATHRELDHMTHNFTPKTHPVWQYFSKPIVFSRSAIAVALTSRHTELSKDPTGEDEIKAMRQMIHDAIHHLKSDCTECPNAVHREVQQRSAAGSPGHADQNEPARQIPLESSPEKSVEQNGVVNE